MKVHGGFDPIIWHRITMPLEGTLTHPYYGQFVEADYTIVPVSDLSEWRHIHIWCHQNIEPGHYTWCGSHFIFVKDEDAVKFSLAWL